MVRTKRARTLAEEDKVIDGDNGPGDGPAVRLGSPGGHADLAEAQIYGLDANLDKKANKMSLNLTVTARDHVLL